MLARTDFDELVRTDAQPAVSIYMPTHPAGREIRQDPIRLKNLLARAAERLGPAARDLLAPAQKLAEDDAFWRHQEQGLAIFLAPGFCRLHRLPIAVPEALALGSQFHIKPLLPLNEDGGRFWLLTVSAARTRLFQGSRDMLIEEAAGRLPQGVQELRNATDYEEGHSAAPALGRRSGFDKAQSRGDSPEELRKTQLTVFLRRVATAVEPLVKRNPAPVVLAARPEIQGHFRQMARWDELEPEGIRENPDALDEAELRRRACRLVGHRAQAAREAALGQLKGLLGTGDGKATTRPEEIVKAAHYGRVGRLLVGGGDGQLWGRFDTEHDRVTVHGGPAEGDVDLIDYAALMTLRHGGNVNLVDPATLPPNSRAAAILRY